LADYGGTQPPVRGRHWCGLQADVGAAPAVDMKKLATMIGAA
jgi:hypothetical protein